MAKGGAVVGVSDHGGWAILVTVARDGTLLDRRRVELVDDTLPALPHHHEGQMLLPEQAVELVEKVRLSAQKHAVLALDAVATAVPQVFGIALRACPQLPPTVADRIKDYRARNVADWVMYRKALARAAQMRGWPVHWYDAKKASHFAGRVLQVESFDDYFAQRRTVVGPPWNQDHKIAMAGALTAATPFT